MDIRDKEVTDPEFINQKIDWEGWPDALEWLISMNFGDDELNQLIYDAAQIKSQLEYFLREILSRVYELKNDNQISSNR